MQLTGLTPYNVPKTFEVSDLLTEQAAFRIFWCPLGSRICISWFSRISGFGQVLLVRWLGDQVTLSGSKCQINNCNRNGITGVTLGMLQDWFPAFKIECIHQAGSLPISLGHSMYELTDATAIVFIVLLPRNSVCTKGNGTRWCHKCTTCFSPDTIAGSRGFFLLQCAEAVGTMLSSKSATFGVDGDV